MTGWTYQTRNPDTLRKLHSVLPPNEWIAREETTITDLGRSTTVTIDGKLLDCDPTQRLTVLKRQLAAKRVDPRIIQFIASYCHQGGFGHNARSVMAFMYMPKGINIDDSQANLAFICNADGSVTFIERADITDRCQFDSSRPVTEFENPAQEIAEPVMQTRITVNPDDGQAEATPTYFAITAKAPMANALFPNRKPLILHPEPQRDVNLLPLLAMIVAGTLSISGSDANAALLRQHLLQLQTAEVHRQQQQQVIQQRFVAKMTDAYLGFMREQLPQLKKNLRAVRGNSVPAILQRQEFLHQIKKFESGQLPAKELAVLQTFFANTLADKPTKTAGLPFLNDFLAEQAETVAAEKAAYNQGLDDTGTQHAQGLHTMLPNALGHVKQLDLPLFMQLSTGEFQRPLLTAAESLLSRGYKSQDIKPHVTITARTSTHIECQLDLKIQSVIHRGRKIHATEPTRIRVTQTMYVDANSKVQMRKPIATLKSCAKEHSSAFSISSLLSRLITQFRRLTASKVKSKAPTSSITAMGFFSDQRPTADQANQWWANQNTPTSMRVR